MPIVRLRRTLIQKTLGLGERGARRSIAAPTEGRQVQKLQADAARDYREFYDAAGTRRTRIGRQTDGKYGIRIWDSGGVLQIDQTWA